MVSSTNTVDIEKVGAGVYWFRSRKFLRLKNLEIDDFLSSKYSYLAEVRGAGGCSDCVGVDTNIRSARVVPRDAIPEAYDLIETEIEESIKPRLASMFNLPFTKTQGNQIVYYEEGGQFSLHRDSGRNFPNRYMSIIKYLEMNCVGGEIYFRDIGRALDVKPGDYVVFFPEIAHSSLEISSGRKTAFVSWYVV